VRKIRFLIEYEVEVDNLDELLDEIGLDSIEEICNMEDVDYVLDESSSYTMELKKAELIE
jgi:hypothetical protein